MYTPTKLEFSYKGTRNIVRTPLYVCKPKMYIIVVVRMDYHVVVKYVTCSGKLQNKLPGYVSYFTSGWNQQVMVSDNHLDEYFL